MKKAAFIIAAVVCSLVVCGPSSAQSRKKPPPLLGLVMEEVQRLFSRVDLLMSSAAQRIAEKGRASEESRSILRDLCKDIPQVMLCAVTDASGLVTAIEPEPYRRFQGTNVIGQTYVARTLSDMQPVLSRSFRNEDGLFGVFFAYPLVSAGKTSEGALLVLFRPDRFIGEAVRRIPLYMPVEVAVLQTDGIVLYGEYPENIGRNVFTDPDTQGYRQLISLAWRVKKEPSGTGTYIPAKSRYRTPVNKQAYWDTASLYGTEWRVLLLKSEERDVTFGVRVQKKPDMAAFDRALRALCKNPETVRDLSSRNMSSLNALFKGFYEMNKGLYSVQFVDAQGINLFGYPRENSLTNYNFYERRAPYDTQFLEGIRDKKEVSFEKPLLEGGTGRFFLCPVFSGDVYLGSIYSVVKSD
jgi:hypothetical protein